jgi:uncharacterized protein YndB with AHSA1/START domain
MTNTVISKSIIIKADSATVWNFLTDKDKLALWFYGAEANLADGEDYMLVGEAADGSTEQKCWGTVQEMVPTSRLVYM